LNHALETLFRLFASNESMLNRSSLCGPVLLAVLAAPLYSQTHRVAAPERVTRAVAVYEWTGDLAKPAAARLVPVSLFIDGHLEDAGVYLTQPVPFALQTGNIYSIEEAGRSEGTIDLEYARNVSTHRSATDDNPVTAWFGYGNFKPLPPEPKAPALHASEHAPVIVASSDPDRPHFVNRSPAADTSSNGKTTSTSSDSTKPADGDPDRPHMNRRSGSNSGSTPPSTSTGDVPADDPDRPTLRHRDPKQDAQRRKQDSGSAVTGMNTSLNDDPSRPTMRRGKPAGLTTTAELKTLPPNLHQIAAVSDAANREPHLFAREWATPTERAATVLQFETLAQPRIANYIAINQLTLPPTATPQPTEQKPKTTARKSTHKNTAAKVSPQPPAAPPVPLSNEQLTPYTLSYDGPPTFVYTVEADVAAGGPVYLTLIAQRLPSGDLQVALSSITDATHLDRTPWMRLVDAVDPDAGHRASLLFELRAQSTRQFALYRLTSATAEQIFVSGVIE
jgi:hypothetical protein